MSRKRKRFQSPLEIQVERGNSWYHHYYYYLTSLAYQLFEWNGLPDSVDPRFLEMSLHTYGYVGFYNDPEIGYIACQGAVSGRQDYYYNPLKFHANMPMYQKTFDLYHYRDMKPPENKLKKYGVVIWNNDYRFSTLPSLMLFAQDLADVKEVISVNVKAQKTPVLIRTNHETLYSMKQLYQQYEGNSPVIFGDKELDPNSLQVLKTDAPYVADRLRQEKNAIWNEVMTFLGIKNANIEKRERMITDEVRSNEEQIQASANIFLKAREEACKRINELYGLNVSVRIRSEIVEEFQRQIDDHLNLSKSSHSVSNGVGDRNE